MIWKAPALTTTTCWAAKNSRPSVKRIQPRISYIDKAQALQPKGVSSEQHRLRPTS
jgi:hypothetical protein